jgi:hypothetical protein
VTGQPLPIPKGAGAYDARGFRYSSDASYLTNANSEELKTWHETFGQLSTQDLVTHVTDTANGLLDQADQAAAEGNKTLAAQLQARAQYFVEAHQPRGDTEKELYAKALRLEQPKRRTT